MGKVGAFFRGGRAQPNPDTPDTTRLLAAVLLVLLAALLVFTLVSILFIRTLIAVLMMLAAVGADLLALLLTRLGKVHAAGMLLCSLLWLLLAGTTVWFAGTQTPAYYGCMAVVVLAITLLGPGGGTAFTALSLAAALAVAVLETAGRLPAPLGPNLPIARWAALACYTSLAAVLQQVSMRNLRRDISRRRQAEEQLRERAARLELLARLSQEMAGLPGVGVQLQRAVAMIAETFQYYNVVIFLLEENELVMRASTLAEARRLVGAARLPLGAGSICGWVAASGSPRLVEDTRREPQCRPLLPQSRTRSELAVPMRLGERVIGVLDVQSSATQAFGEIDVSTMQTIADQVALAIENARLFEEARMRADRLAVINRIGSAAGSTLELDRLMVRLYEEIADSLPCDAFFVALCDEKAEMLDFRIQVDEGVRSAPERQPIGPGLTSQVIATRRPLLISDFERERERLPAAVLFGSMKPPGSWLGVPMMAGERLIGVMSVQAYRTHAYTGEDVQLLATLADQATAAVENARLYAAVQQELAERRNLEGQLVQAQKMEAVGRLAGGLAHDFNNLLTAVEGYTDLILLDADETTRGRLEEIKGAVQRGASLTRQLLAFSRKQILRPQRVDLNAVIRDTGKLLRRLIGEDVELVTALAADLRPVEADVGQITQVILNLAVNARDAMPAGGRLTIETANIRITGCPSDPSRAGAWRSPASWTPPAVPGRPGRRRRPPQAGGAGQPAQAGPPAQSAHACQLRPLELKPGSYALLSVSDTGTGMSEEVLSHLFEPFFTTKEEGKGTGLGLATVHGIVQQSRGGIEVASTPGKGSTFRIYLPHLPEEEPPRRSPDERRLEGGGETVLVVEDERMLRDYMRQLLTRYGYAVLEASDSRRALEVSAAYAGPIRLLVTDVIMPGGMSGREMARRMREQRPQVRVLYVSGHTEDTIIRQGVFEQGLAFLQKPFDHSALLERIRALLDRPDPGPV